MPLILSPDLDYYGGMDMKHIGDLTPDPRNARKHGERNIGQIERSLEAYGAATTTTTALRARKFKQNIWKRGREGSRAARNVSGLANASAPGT
jgi:hypothetical protein